MQNSEQDNFITNIEARWQSTSPATCIRAFDLCKPFEYEIVIKAMDALRLAMKADHLTVDADRLAAVCLQMRDGTGAAQQVTRTSEYMRQIAAEGQQAASMKAALDAMHVDPADAERAEAICAQKYDACWKMFGPKHKARLMKLELKA